MAAKQQSGHRLPVVKPESWTALGAVLLVGSFTAAACESSDDTRSTQTVDEGSDAGVPERTTVRIDNGPTALFEDAGVAPLTTDAGVDSGLKDIKLFGGTLYPGGAASSTRIPVTARSVSCGDGIRGIDDEQCDDGPDATVDGGVVEDSCAADCTVQDLLAVLPGESDGIDRYLGEGRHPAAADDGGFAVAFVEPDIDVGRVGVRRFSSAGARLGPTLDVSTGSTPVLFANPVVAPLPGGQYAVAWTDFGGDGDELGIALRRIDEEGAVGAIRYANTGRDFSQSDPDVLWTGSELVVAWVDYADAFTGPDVAYRTFDEELGATGDETVLADSPDSEANVALGRFGSGWAAAWRSGLVDDPGMETIVVARANDRWSVAPSFPAGPPEDRPALVELDETHLLLLFTEGTDPSSLGIYDTARLRGAILDTEAMADGEPVTTLESFPIAPLVPPYDMDATLSQSRPNAVRVGAYLYVGWQSERTLSDSLGDELWLKPMRWDGDALDLSITEVRVPRQAAHHEADQRFPALAASPLGPFGALVTAWDDLGRTFSPDQGTPDVGVALMPVPLLGQEPPIPYVGCGAGELLAQCDAGLHCAQACNGTVGDQPDVGIEDATCELVVSDLFGVPLTDETPGTSCGDCPAGQVSCFGEFCFVPCDGVVECGQEADGVLIDDESGVVCGGP